MKRQGMLLGVMKQTPPLGSRKSSPDGALDASTKPARSPIWSTPWLWLGVALAVATLAYGVGRIQGVQALTNAEQRQATAIQTVRANLGACEIDRNLLAVRRSLALVALSLDRRNFGVAESHRREASLALEQPTLIELAGLASILTAIRALNLSVDPDPGAKREQVIAASEALDRLLAARGRTALPTPAAGAAKVGP